MRLATSNSIKGRGDGCKLTQPLFLLLIICVFGSSAAGQPWLGSGTAGDPYQIWTAEQMNEIGANQSDWDKHFKLMANIDLSAYTGTSFHMIGTPTYPDYFTGVFDGNGRTISNFTYTSTWTDYIGIFRRSKGLIKDLGLINPNVDAGNGSRVGGLVGHGEGPPVFTGISNCYVEGGNVSGATNVGGLAGIIKESTISNCYATASVSGTTNVGGLVGQNAYWGTIKNCYSEGGVSGDDNVGGLVGHNDYYGTISNCYSTGSVSGTTKVGGLVGEGVPVCASFWDTQTSGQSTSSGGTGKTTAQMKDANTYVGWGCDLAWTIDDGVDYPHLIWEGMPGEIISAQLSDFVAGAGTESEPYLIYTAEELSLIGLFWCEFDKHFKLMADIDFSGYSGTSFNIIGYSGLPFTGVFDGNGHTISDFTKPPKGLFGVVDGPGAEIKDLGFIDPNIAVGQGSGVGPLAIVLNDGTISGCYVEGGSLSGNTRIGGLVGSSGGTITNCYSTASVSGLRSLVGGLVGKNEGTITNCYSTGSVHSGGLAYGEVGGLVGVNSGTITNCYSEGDVSGRWDVGGLVGDNDGTISNCYALGSVSGTQERVGGLVAENHGTGTITNCYSTGNVSGDFHVGGLVGRTVDGGTISNCYAWGSVSAAQDRVGGLVGHHGGTMTNCYSIGSATGTTDVGGVVGWNEGSVSACFWDTQTSGRSNMCGSSQYGASGCDDDNGITTAQMQMGGTFTSAGWDFVDETDNGIEDIWRLCNEGTEYPQLNWEYPLGDFGCPDGVDGIDLGVLCGEWLFELISADVAPGGGDGIVNFLDWAIFANGWQITVDYDDLADFAEQWLGRALSADVWPGGGNLFVDFSDWAVFAAAWQSTPASPNWNRRCDIAPAGGDEIVDMDDIVVFMQQWLTAGSYYRHLDADIAPDRRDGVVNMLDFAVLAENWLEGL